MEQQPNFWILLDIDRDRPSYHGGIYHRLTWFNWDTQEHNITDIVPGYRNSRLWGDIVDAPFQHWVCDTMTVKSEPTKQGHLVVNADRKKRLIGTLEQPDVETLLEYLASFHTPQLDLFLEEHASKPEQPEVFQWGD